MVYSGGDGRGEESEREKEFGIWNLLMFRVLALRLVCLSWRCNDGLKLCVEDGIVPKNYSIRRTYDRQIRILFWNVRIGRFESFFSPKMFLTFELRIYFRFFAKMPFVF